MVVSSIVVCRKQRAGTAETFHRSPNSSSIEWKQSAMVTQSRVRRSSAVAQEPNGSADNPSPGMAQVIAVSMTSASATSNHNAGRSVREELLTPRRGTASPPMESGAGINLNEGGARDDSSPTDDYASDPIHPLAMFESNSTETTSRAAPRSPSMQSASFTTTATAPPAAAAAAPVPAAASTSRSATAAIPTRTSPRRPNGSARSPRVQRIQERIAREPPFQSCRNQRRSAFTRRSILLKNQKGSIKRWVVTLLSPAKLTTCTRRKNLKSTF